jgi:NAD(P)-dependent dehydrogenase (short-subunit alcohol dehydrogenase family)
MPLSVATSVLPVMFSLAYNPVLISEGGRMRVVVVGASSGLGRCIGTGLAQRGAQVALLARRRERLVDAAKDAGPGTLAIQCDVTDAASCHAAVTEAATSLGGIDGIVYAPGIGPLVRLVDMDAEQWHSVLATNVVGASLFTAAALPHLKASGGTAAYLTSVSASETAPWPGLGAYAVSKAALDKLIEAWRGEHSDVGFTRLIVGDCAGGEGDAVVEFSSGWDPELANEMLTIWIERRYIAGNLLPVERLVDAVELVLRAGAVDAIPSITVAPRPAM